MLIAQHSVTTKASPQDIWKFFSNPSMWPVWDPALEYVHFTGPFVQGTQGRLKPKQGPEVTFTVTQLNEPYSFTTVNKWPGAQLIFSHTVDQQNGITTITHHIEMTGFLKYLFGFLVGGKIKAGLPQAMQNLVKLAEQE